MSDERIAKFAAAARQGKRDYLRAFSAGDTHLEEESTMIARAVMAVADAELADLHAEVATKPTLSQP